MILSFWTDWISAVSTAVLGVVGIVITVWQWRASGFRPHGRLEMDARRQAMRLTIVNSGRGEGVISEVEAVLNSLAVPDTTISGYPDGKYTGTTLGPGEFMALIIQIEHDEFPTNVKAAMRWSSKSKTLTPTPVNVGLYGLPSILPP